MDIIDTHCHIGTSKFSGTQTSESELIQGMAVNEISTSLVMPQPTQEFVPSVHQRIYQLSKQYPGEIYGMANLDPWMEEEEYRSEMRKCFEQYGFVAIKLHPQGHNISPLSPNAEKIYEIAHHYHIPVLIHTGLGTPNSLPSLIIEPAKRYPDVTFILSHAGFAIYTSEAIVTANQCENVILEPSWCPAFMVRKMIDTVGIDRIIYGSDHINNIPVELAKYRSIAVSDSELEHIFETNPKRIFRL